MKFHLDNSAFSMLNCARKFQLRVVEGLVDPPGPEAAFGSAVHTGLELLDKGISPDDMLSAIHKQHFGTNIPGALSLITFYKATNKLPPPLILANGLPAVEVKFSYKHSSLIIPNSHELLDIFLEGTIDRMHIDKDILVIQDYKTTAVGSSYQLDKTLSSYALSFQLPFYLYAVKNFGILPASYQDFIDSRKYRMEIHLMAYNTSPPTFKKHIRHAFNDDFIDREVPLIINSKIQEAVNIAGLSSAAPHTGMTVYKACDNCGFRPACLVMGEAREDEILSRYDKATYDPLSFR